MKLLRATIRRIILESPELQDELDQLVFNRDDGVYFGDEDSTSHREYAASRGLTLRGKLRPEEDYHKNQDIRREVKAFWNENADHDFWNNEIAALHDLGYYGGGISNAFYANAEMKPEKDLPFASFIEKYPLGQRQKDEMSAYGCYDTLQKITRKMNGGDLNLCVKLQGVVTYVSTIDSYTESRSEATPGDRERHAGSGMPKRPAIGKGFYASGVLFDKKDLDAKGEKIGELVVDNWTWDTVYARSASFKPDDIEKLKSLCSEEEINLVLI